MAHQETSISNIVLIAVREVAKKGVKQGFEKHPIFTRHQFDLYRY